MAIPSWTLERRDLPAVKEDRAGVFDVSMPAMVGRRVASNIREVRHLAPDAAASRVGGWRTSRMWGERAWRHRRHHTTPHPARQRRLS
ncbi:MAG: hypothetical protein ACOC96_07465 [Actinomycetota bacterium]